MSSTKLLILRHGETQWNSSKRIQGCTDIDLNENGKAQALAAAKYIRTLGIDVIYSSPLNRALETANIVAGGQYVHVDERLREIPFGSWEGRRFSDLREDSNFQKFLNGVDGCPFAETGETIKSRSEKNLETLTDICNKHRGKTILIVSHGAWIKTSIVGLLGLQPVMYHRFKLSNTGLTTFIYNDRNVFDMTGFNETCHLCGSGENLYV